MSNPPRPAGDRTQSTHPALDPNITQVPVTPAAHTAGQDAYFQPQADSSEPPLPFDPETVTPGPQWNPNTYFPPTQQPAGTKSAEELLKRLSRSGGDLAQKTDLADVDPQAAHPNLNLSGGVISATSCVPYNISYSPGNDWVCLSITLACKLLD